jgi:hypothetical protein
VGDGDDHQGDAQPGAVASSTSDATVRTRAKHAGVPLRRVRAGELREEFLYELKAGPAGGDATVTGAPTTPWLEALPN